MKDSLNIFINWKNIEENKKRKELEEEREREREKDNDSELNRKEDYSETRKDFELKIKKLTDHNPQDEDSRDR